MHADPWLPKGYALPGGATTGSLRYAGDRWQIWTTSGPQNALLALPELVEEWSGTALVDAAVFMPVTFGPTTYRYALSPHKFVMEPVATWRGSADKDAALSFSLALSRSRKCLPDASFHDAIFFEQYSCLLPTRTRSPAMADADLLGKWLSGGVAVSAHATRRLSRLIGWFEEDVLTTIIRAAGIGDARSCPHDENTGAAPPHQNGGARNKTDTFSLPGRRQLEQFFNEHIIDIVRNAERYQKMGIGFPSAIVLHGPPGCGKTFAVERLAEFLDWPVFSIDSNTVGSTYIHQTSMKIAEVFDRAMQEAPSLVVIDEMEAFLSARSAGGTGNLHHVEEVAAFLRRIPEAAQNRVLIIGMTNLPDMIDPAILRRGRFDHVIEVGMPSEDEVTALMTALFDGLPQEDDLNIAAFSRTLAGRPLSDVAYVVREACRLSARHGKNKIDNASVRAAIDASGRTMKGGNRVESRATARRRDDYEDMTQLFNGSKN